MKNHASTPEIGHLQTLARGLDVLGAFRTDDGPLGNRELALRTGLPKSTVSRITHTLAKFGYIEHIPDIDKFRMGLGALRLGNVAFATIPFMAAADQIMQRLAEELGLAVYLTVKDDNRLVIVHCWRPPAMTGIASIWLNVGFPFSLNNSAAGLAYMASIRAEKAVTMLEHAISTEGAEKEDLIKSVEDARTQLKNRGFFTSLGGWNQAINGLAVPFKNNAPNNPYIFVAGANADALTPEMILQNAGPKMLQCVQQLENSGGYRAR